MGKKKTPAPTANEVTITAPKMEYATFQIRGVTPYCPHRFSDSAIETMKANMLDPTAKNSRKKEARDFEKDMQEAMYIFQSPEKLIGTPGIPCVAFKKALVSACRLTKYAMTRARLAVFVLPDGFDSRGMGLVRLEGKPEMNFQTPRVANKAPDIRVRPLFHEWSAKVRIRYDSGEIKLSDVTNLLYRVGCQIGIGDGREDAVQSGSVGQGWGMFDIATD